MNKKKPFAGAREAKDMEKKHGARPQARTARRGAGGGRELAEERGLRGKEILLYNTFCGARRAGARSSGSSTAVRGMFFNSKPPVSIMFSFNHQYFAK